MMAVSSISLRNREFTYGLFSRNPQILPTRRQICRFKRLPSHPRDRRPLPNSTPSDTVCFPSIFFLPISPYFSALPGKAVRPAGFSLIIRVTDLRPVRKSFLANLPINGEIASFFGNVLLHAMTCACLKRFSQTPGILPSSCFLHMAPDQKGCEEDAMRTSRAFWKYLFTSSEFPP